MFFVRRIVLMKTLSELATHFFEYQKLPILLMMNRELATEIILLRC